MGDDPTPAGGLIAGRFRLGGLLGSGGTASVFAATDVVTGRSVAIKLLHPHLSESEPLRQAFLTEARRTALVQHPSVVEIVDVGTFEDGAVTIAWIAQELIAGVTLTEHVRTVGALTAASAGRVGTAILGALEAAHASGLVHRDVSPANVLVHFAEGEPAVVKLLDFGLADVAGATTLGGDVLRSSASEGAAGVVGNVNFASPEQLRGEPVDQRGDLYQVGGLLYFALTGRYPFEGGDRDAVVRAHLQSPPPVASVRARGVTPELDRVIVRAMLKDPADRYATAGEMRDALQNAVVALAPIPRTTVTRLMRTPPAALVTPAPQTAAIAVDGSSRRDVSGWSIAVWVLAIVAAVAIAVPLIASAGRPEPVPVASGSSTPTSTPTGAPSPTESHTAAPVLATVPPLGSLDEMVRALAAAGLVAGAVTHTDSALPEGTVLASDPAPGSRAPSGSTIDLTVASGSNLVPTVEGMDAAGAAAALRAAGFEPLQTVVTSDRPAGLLVGSEPASGSSVRLGSAVTVFVSAERAPTPSPTPSSTPTQNPPTPRPTPVPTEADAR